MTVPELLRRTTSRELAEWQAYERLEPFGEERADLRAAIVACVMANSWRGKESKAFVPGDFMPDFDPETREQTPEEQIRVAQQIAAAFRATRRASGSRL